MEPSFIVCDEAVSALDVSIQGQIINLLEDLQRRLGLAYLFIAHDLAVVRHISMRVVVMYFGRIMEVADRDTIYREAAAPLYQGAARRRAGARPDGREGPRAAADPGRAAEPPGAADRMRLQYPLPDGQPGVPGGYSAAGREAAGTLCRLHQGLMSRDNDDKDDNTGGNAMTTRRTALKGMAGALALGAGRVQLRLHQGAGPGRREARRHAELRDQRGGAALRSARQRHLRDAAFRRAVLFDAAALQPVEVPGRSKAIWRSPGRSRRT